MKSILAAVLSAALLLSFPLAGAVGGAWVAVVYMMPEPEPEPEPTADDERRCGMWWLTQLTDQLARGLATGFIGFVGFATGLAAGVTIALPAVNTLSEWSARGSLTDDEADE